MRSVYGGDRDETAGPGWAKPQCTKTCGTRKPSFIVAVHIHRKVPTGVRGKKGKMKRTRRQEGHEKKLKSV